MACSGNRMVCRRAVTTLCSLSCFVVFQSLSRVRLFVTHGLQHARLICPPLSPRVCSNWCLLSWWCCLAISSSAAPFSACPHSFPASGSFPMSWLVTSGSWSIRASASASVLPMNNSGLTSFRMDWFELLATQGTLKRVFSSTPVWKHQFFGTCNHVLTPYHLELWLSSADCMFSNET